MGVIWSQGGVEDWCYGVSIRGCVRVHVDGDSFCGLCFDCMVVVPESVSQVIFGHPHILNGAEVTCKKVHNASCRAGHVGGDRE